MEFRRLIFALLTAVAVYIAYMWVYQKLNPPPKPGPPLGTIPGINEPSGDGPISPTAPVTSTSSAPAAAYAFTAGPSAAPVSLGGGARDSLKIELTSRGAAIEHIWLTERLANGRYAHRQGPKTEAPYELLAPVQDGGGPYGSFTTKSLWVRDERGNHEYRLNELIWSLAPADEGGGAKVTFATALQSIETGEPLLRLSKTYDLSATPLLARLEIAVENLSGQLLTVVVEQNGPLGIHYDPGTRDAAKLVWATRDGEKPSLSNAQRAELAKQSEPRRLGGGDEKKRFLWTALGNKYFAVFMRPLPLSGEFAGYVQAVFGEVAEPASSALTNDIVSRYVLAPSAIAVGQTARLGFELYAGPKDPDAIKRSNPALVAPPLGYGLVQAQDTPCCSCTFEPLPSLMTWLLETIHFFVRNYGVAILILVLIVRGLLHPLAVFQQKSMYRMQEAQARLQPRMAAIKERYANDKVKLNQEMMKVYSEENINPMAPMVGMVPLFLQMPILVALWTAVNTDIHLRNAPFDGWWIVDLSSPDALINFSQPVHIPIYGDIYALNLLPILMGVSMLLQQKYMPRPAAHAKQAAARQHAQQNPNAPRKAGGLTPEEQLRQQQIMSYLMSAMFPLMFYSQPSGLVLYWLATNVFGIFESLIIRKQIRLEKERRASEGPPPPKVRKPGLVSKLFKYLSEQAETLQHKADAVSDPRKKR